MAGGSYLAILSRCEQRLRNLGEKEVESAARFPSKKLEYDPPIAITDKGGVALHVLLRWPQPLDSTMPLLSSLDDLFAQGQMSAIARQRASNLARRATSRHGKGAAISIARPPHNRTLLVLTDAGSKEDPGMYCSRQKAAADRPRKGVASPLG